jgi:hypothetical protein
MEQTFIGNVFMVEGIQPLTNGFKQLVILHRPDMTDLNGKVLAKEEYYQVNIWSQNQTDSRFLTFSDKGQKKKALCRLKGERWYSQYSKDYVYALKANLKQWE